MKKTFSSIAVAQALAPASTVPLDPTLHTRLAALYTLTQQNDFVFGSPLGPFFHRGQNFFMPRFVYFGPDTRDDSLRLALLGGFDGRELRGSLALAAVVERLALDPVAGKGLHLSFFPVVDVLGTFSDAEKRPLSAAHWGFSREPEISLLEKDARQRGYHGFVTIGSTTEETIVARLRGRGGAFADGVQIVAAEEFEGWPVRFESSDPHESPAAGPLTVGEDLRLEPFELNLAFPLAWPQVQLDTATVSILQRFVARHAAIQAYAQHL